jgi:hypothetical protein
MTKKPKKPPPTPAVVAARQARQAAYHKRQVEYAKLIAEHDLISKPVAHLYWAWRDLCIKRDMGEATDEEVRAARKAHLDQLTVRRAAHYLKTGRKPWEEIRKFR